MARRLTSDDTVQLARFIRRTPLLDLELRRHWLSILPYLTPADRVRLREILQAGSALDTPTPPPKPPPESVSTRITLPEP